MLRESLGSCAASSERASHALLLSYAASTTACNWFMCGVRAGCCADSGPCGGRHEGPNSLAATGGPQLESNITSERCAPTIGSQPVVAILRQRASNTSQVAHEASQCKSQVCQGYKCTCWFEHRTGHSVQATALLAGARPNSPAGTYLALNTNLSGAMAGPLVFLTGCNLATSSSRSLPPRLLRARTWP